MYSKLIQSINLRPVRFQSLWNPVTVVFSSTTLMWVLINERSKYEEVISPIHSCVLLHTRHFLQVIRQNILQTLVITSWPETNVSGPVELPFLLKTKTQHLVHRYYSKRVNASQAQQPGMLGRLAIRKASGATITLSAVSCMCKYKCYVSKLSNDSKILAQMFRVATICLTF